MDQIVNKESLGKMAGLQKEYIDQGDQRNAEAIAANSEKLDNMLLGAGYAVAEYTQGSTDYRPKYEAGIGKGILDYFCPIKSQIRFSEDRNRLVVTALQGNNFLKDSKGNYIKTILIDLSIIGKVQPQTEAATDRLMDSARIQPLYRNSEEPWDSTAWGFILLEHLFDQNNKLLCPIIFGKVDNPEFPSETDIPDETQFDAVEAGMWREENFLYYGRSFPTGTPYKEILDFFMGGVFEYPAIYKDKELSLKGYTLYAKLEAEYGLVNIEGGSITVSSGNLATVSGIQAITILYPWEYTNPQPCFMGVANTQPLYLCDNQVGASGRYWKGIFFNPRWDGLDLSKWVLPPTAIGCGPITESIDFPTASSPTAAGVLFRLVIGESANSRSNAGLLPENPFYDAERTYPLVNTVNQVNNMKWARYNNRLTATSEDGNTSEYPPYPFAEGGHFAHNVFITALELAAGTKYIHAANLFGSGISSNDGCNANNFFTSGGVRFRVKDTGDGTPGTWQYKTFGSNCAPLQYNESGATTDMSNLLTQYYPKEQCMESQMAASMATELGVAPAIEPNEENIEQFLFKFYGRDYYYMNVPGFDGLQEGKMNCRVYKYMRHDVQAWMDGKETVFEMEVIYRMSLFMGVNLTGDIWAYYGGGLEMVGTPKAGATAGSTGNQIELYVEPDQTKWHSETAITKPAGQRFDFEDTYKLLATVNNLGDSYTLTREGYTPFKVAKASSMAQGECYYQWDNAHWISGTNRVRVLSLFRCWSTRAYCSPRALHAHFAASNTSRSYSGSAQALVEFE